MIIDEKLLMKLEKLSSLKLNDNERNELVKDFDDILKFVDVLNEVNTNNLEIKISDYTPLRDDVVKKSDVIKDILKHAPSTSGAFFSVPKIIE